MLTKEELDFIQTNLKADCNRLLLSCRGKLPGIDVERCARIIEARRRMEEKVPDWYANPTLDYPMALSVEQCSSQATALYKRAIIENLPQCVATADITGGMGIDSWFISARGTKRHLYIERFPELCMAAEENFALLGGTGITVRCADSRESLKELELFKPTLIYADPARRASGSGGKLILINEYEPDMTGLKERLLEIAPYLLIKVSPMADISLNLKLLPETIEVHAVAVANECKELLFLLRRGAHEENPKIVAANLNRSGEIISSFAFTRSEEDSSHVEYAESLGEMYLFEPNKALLKAGAFRSLATRFNMKKISPSTHLYVTSDMWLEAYGRLFGIESVERYSKELVKRIQRERLQTSIVARNFPLKTEELRKVLKTTEGGNATLFATTLNNGTKCIIRCKRM